MPNKSTTEAGHDFLHGKQLTFGDADNLWRQLMKEDEFIARPTGAGPDARAAR